MPQATSLAAEIKKKYGVETELIPGAGGIFDVEVDGSMVYSKHETGRFPKHKEVLDALAPMAG